MLPVAEHRLEKKRAVEEKKKKEGHEDAGGFPR